MQYETVVGLEVHAELCTKSKAFCGCKNAYGAPPNTLCCPVCTGLPGTLPVLNGRVVEYAIKMGLALGCEINLVSEFARKHYSSPDLPKGYQITQHQHPLCKNGKLTVLVDGKQRHFGIERIHIEEDTGKLVKKEENGGVLVDYNRSGVPLIEIVTKPDMRSANEAKAAMEGIAQILRYLDISDVKMQEGSLRADVNVSLRPKGQPGYGTRCEMKNINSFMAVYRAILHESVRQLHILQAGGHVQQETRHWNDDAKESLLLRRKENAEDYRYLPEPDLPALVLSETLVRQLKTEIPELPLAKIERYQKEYGLPQQDVLLLCAQPWRAAFFEQTLATNTAPPKMVANWLLGDVAKALNARKKSIEKTNLTPKGFGELLAMLAEGSLSGTAAKQMLEHMMDSPTAPRTLAKELDLLQTNDETALTSLVCLKLKRHGPAILAYFKGKNSVFSFLMGQCMKESGGRANPNVLRRVLARELERYRP